jgi:adenylate kinase family enzyme
VQRISVVGSSASGKTRVSRRLSEVLGLPHLELDAVYHQPGWQPIDPEEFTRRVSDFAAGERWVIDGNYTSHGVADLVWPRADALVWLDLPRTTVMRRVITRTLRRVATRQELWNGNREPWTNLYSRDPEQNIILWAWTRFLPVRRRYELRSTDGTWAHLEVFRLCTSRDVGTFLAGVRLPG